MFPVLAEAQIDYIRRIIWLAETDATIISTIISSIIASLFAWWLVSRVTGRYERERDIHNRVVTLIQLAMDHPVVELPSTCAKWPNPDLSEADKVRYENYCCFVFNLVVNVWEHCGKNRQKANKVLYIDELIRKHQVWWNADSDNTEAYSDDDFQQFVKEVVGTNEQKAMNATGIQKSDSN
jgi:hypothetical protein